MKTIKKKRTEDERNRRSMYLISFLLPVIGMLIVFAADQIFPFGDRSFLRTDLYHQYAPFYAELGHKLKSGGSLFYTWDIGGGTNFFSLIGYYLSSIFNFLIVLVPDRFYLEFLTYLVVFKMGLAGLTFSVLLQYRKNETDMKIPLFSVFYAMSGYLAAYSWNVMWMDCVWCAPLILLGIEKIVKEKKCLLYIISLGYAILSNYYIAIMLCIFSVLYFFLQFAQMLNETEPKKKVDRVFSVVMRYCFSSLLAGGLAGIILLPEIKALGLTASSDISFPKTLTQYFSIFELLGRHLFDVAIENGLDHWPNIYCGIIVFLCIPLYYMSRRVSFTKKAGNTILILFMLFSFSMNIPNFIWHGFHYPNSLPCRQSFLYIALILVMCYEAVSDLEELTAQRAGIAFFIAASFIILAQYLLKDEEAYTTASFWVSLVFLVIYGLIFYAVSNKRRFGAGLLLIALLTVTVESTVNMALTSVTTISRDDYLNYTESYQELIERAYATTNGFFRFEKVARKTKNDGAFVGYPSLSTFSSVSYGNMSDFYKSLGMESSMNAYSNNGITPLMNSLLAVRYILTTTTQQESQLMTLYEQNEDCYLYQNLFTMSLGYMLPLGFNIDWDLDFTTPVSAQNAFSRLCGHGDILQEIYDVESDSSSMDITAPFNCHVYVMLENDDVDDLTSNINGSTKDYERTSRGYLIDLGYIGPDDEVSITAEEGNLKASAYYVDEDELISLIKDLKEEELKVTTWEDTQIEGTIYVEDEGLFFLSIAYDPGWTLYVDGEKTEFYEFEDSFISCDLEEGEHTIRLTYTPDGFKTGLLISLVSLLLLIGLIVLSKKKKTAEKKEEESLPNAKEDLEPAEVINEEVEEASFEMESEESSN